MGNQQHTLISMGIPISYSSQAPTLNCKSSMDICIDPFKFSLWQRTANRLRSPVLAEICFWQLQLLAPAGSTLATRQSTSLCRGNSSFIKMLPPPPAHPWPRYHLTATITSFLPTTWTMRTLHASHRRYTSSILHHLHSHFSRVFQRMVLLVCRRSLHPTLLYCCSQTTMTPPSTNTRPTLLCWYWTHHWHPLSKPNQSSQQALRAGPSWLSATLCTVFKPTTATLLGRIPWLLLSTLGVQLKIHSLYFNIFQL